MAKVRRSSAKPKADKTKKKPSSSATKSKPRPKSAKPAKKAAPRAKAPAKKPAKAAGSQRKRAAQVAAGARQRPRAPQPPPPPLRRSTYADAVAVYDRGMQAFHARKFKEAGEILASIVSLYPEEKELHERAQMYMNVCARHMTSQAAAPKTAEERTSAATLALNNGRADEAIAILKPQASDDPASDSAAYLLGVAFAMKHDVVNAMAHLERALKLNPDNRDLIRKEADLEWLRQTDQFQALLDAPVASGRKRKT